MTFFFYRGKPGMLSIIKEMD